MALALVNYEDLFSLVSGYLYRARGVYNRVGCSATSVPMCIGCVSMYHSEGEFYIYKPQKPSGPNLLDESLKDFIVNPADLP
jgi:hypothetical protein